MQVVTQNVLHIESFFNTKFERGFLSYNEIFVFLYLEFFIDNLKL